MRRFWMACTLLTTITLCGCGPGDGAGGSDSSGQSSGSPGDGDTSSTGYVDDYFGFGIGFGDSWEPQYGMLDVNGVIVLGSTGMRGNGSINLDRAGDATTLLYLERDGSSFNVSCALPVNVMTGVPYDTPREYMDEKLNWLHSLSEDWTGTNDVREVTLGGRTMVRVDGYYQWPRETKKMVPVSQLVFFDEGYAVVISMVSENTDDTAELESILNTFVSY